MKINSKSELVTIAVYATLFFLVLTLIILTIRIYLINLKPDNIADSKPKVDITYYPESEKYRPPKEPTPTPIGYVRSDKDWSYFKDPIGFAFKSPKSWDTTVFGEDVKFLLEHQDWVTEVTIIPDGEDSDQMPGNYDFLEIIYPINVNGAHSDFGKNYEKGLTGLMEKNPGSYLTNIGGKRALVSNFKPGKPPENFQGDWSNQYSKFIYIDLGDNRILTISYYYDTDEETNMKMFDNIIDSIRFEQ